MQCVQAAQLTFEDYFLEHLEMPPMKIVGYEGVLGFLMMVLGPPGDPSLALPGSLPDRSIGLPYISACLGCPQQDPQQKS